MAKYGASHLYWAPFAEADEFSLPTISPATDELGQHYVFEFDALDEDDDDGAAGD